MTIKTYPLSSVNMYIYSCRQTRDGVRKYDESVISTSTLENSYFYRYPVSSNLYKNYQKKRKPRKNNINCKVCTT